MATWKSRLAAYVLLVLAVLPATGATAADPAISIVDEKPELRIVPFWPDKSPTDPCATTEGAILPFEGGMGLKDEHFNYVVQLLLRNDSTETRSISVTILNGDARGGFVPGTICVRGGGSYRVAQGSERQLVPGEARYFRTVALDRAHSVTHAAVQVTAQDVAGAAKALQSTAILDVDLMPHSEKYWAVLLTAVVLGGVVGAIGAARCGGSNLKSSIKADAAWKLSDSWATTVSAAGAVLTTILGASGLLDEVAPTVNVPRIVGLSLVFGALAVVAPIVTTAGAHFKGRKDDKDPRRVVAVMSPTVWSMLLGGTLTVIGVFGQLALIVLLLEDVQTTTWTKVVADCLILAAAVAVAIYAWRTWRSLAQAAPPADVPAEEPIPIKVIIVDDTSEADLGEVLLAGASNIQSGYMFRVAPSTTATSGVEVTPGL